MGFVTPSSMIYPYLLVNIGSGVSMIKVSGPKDFVRVGGTSLGGGTLWGLLSLLTGAKTFDDMLGMAERGDNARVDMLVGDIYGTDYGKIGLKSTTIASSFGKVFRLKKEAEKNEEGPDDELDENEDGKMTPVAEETAESLISHNENELAPESDLGGDTEHLDYPSPAPLKPHVSADSKWEYPSPAPIKHAKEDFDYPSPAPGDPSLERDPDAPFGPEDISRSLLYAISNNIGQIAYLQSSLHNLPHIYFGGSFIRGHRQTMNTLSYAIKFWSKGEKKAYFLRHEGYLGAVGAFLKRQPKNWGRRGSFDGDGGAEFAKDLGRGREAGESAVE